MTSVMLSPAPRALPCLGARSGLAGTARQVWRVSRLSATSTSANTVVPDEAEAIISAAKPGTFVSETELQKAQDSFPIPPHELITLAKLWAATDGGLKRPEMLAEDFEFRGPVVGPLSGSQYLTTVSGFKITDAFSDLKPNLFGFQVDPFMPNRVYYISQATATHDGPLPFSPGRAPTGKRVESVPQMISVVFNEEGKVTRYNIGYPIDRTVGNTGGLGGLYGLLYAIGQPLPFPEAQPWKPSIQYRLFIAFTRFMGWLKSLSPKQ